MDGRKTESQRDWLKKARRQGKGWEKGKNRLDVYKGDRNDLGAGAGECHII